MLIGNPDCVQAVAQLVTMGSFNIFTDMVLILIPLPLVIKSGLPAMRYGSLEISLGDRRDTNGLQKTPAIPPLQCRHVRRLHNGYPHARDYRRQIRTESSDIGL